jgi:hypothetical protein
MTTIKVCEFSRHPGPRFKNEGEHSGEEFRETQLRPAFERARSAGECLAIDLDGVEYGYPTSFLEEAFGGLARIYGPEPVLETLNYLAVEEPLLVDEINGYVRRARKTGPPTSAR